MQGKVIRSTGSWYQVRTADGKEWNCKIKGNFRLRGIRSTNPVAVGDNVEIAENSEETAFITEIHDRKNYIIRKASNLSKQSHILAANLDLSLLITTIARPVTSTTFIDRFLAGAEAYRVPAAIVFNKADDLQNEEKETAEYLQHLYRNIGYACFSVSALKGKGLAELKTLLENKTTLLAGNSGVGKSTLLNALIPSAAAKTAKISEAHGTGLHTTTFSEWFDLPGGGALIDIPGIKGFGTFNMRPEEITHYFKDIFQLSSNCRFNNCTHQKEPGCAVLSALEQHLLAPTRYASYLSMLEDYNETKYREAY